MAASPAADVPRYIRVAYLRKLAVVPSLSRLWSQKHVKQGEQMVEDWEGVAGSVEDDDRGSSNPVPCRPFLHPHRDFILTVQAH
jgi:hypothetical protein